MTFLMNDIFLTSGSLICDNGMYRALLIVQTYRKGQKQPNNHSCTELSKTQFFTVSLKKPPKYQSLLIFQNFKKRHCLLEHLFCYCSYFRVKEKRAWCASEPQKTA